jgi:hypothetical protein
MKGPTIPEDPDDIDTSDVDDDILERGQVARILSQHGKSGVFVTDASVIQSLSDEEWETYQRIRRGEDFTREAEVVGKLVAENFIQFDGDTFEVKHEHIVAVLPTE